MIFDSPHLLEKKICSWSKYAVKPIAMQENGFLFVLSYFHPIVEASSTELSLVLSRCLQLRGRDDTPTDMIASKHQLLHKSRHTTHTHARTVSLSLIVLYTGSKKQTQPIASLSLTAMMDHLSTSATNQGWKGCRSHTWALTWSHLLHSLFLSLSCPHIHTCTHTHTTVV